MLMGPILDVLGADLPEHGVQVAVPADQVEIRGAIVRAPTKLEDRQQLAVFRADYVIGDVVLIRYEFFEGRFLREFFDALYIAGCYGH
ncbi:hypothetical protein D3C75_1284800 [compost metagenome]